MVPRGITATESFLAGTRLGAYRIVRLLTVGGMGEIYLATHVGSGGIEKTCVLKRMLPSFARDPEFVRMFLDEARITIALSHPNIVHVHDVGRESGSLFLAMEPVHGEDLRTIVKTARHEGRPIPIDQAVSIVLGAAAGLHHAHEKRGPAGEWLSIVHRDVCPGNVLVTYDGCVKVTDFGVAKAAFKSSRTRTGTVRGTVPYMSPEQCQGQPVDRRSDVFALGVLLYELTTGTLLFDADNDFAIMRKIVDDALVPPSSIVPDYPADLEAIVMRALMRDVEVRYATAEQLQSALEHYARTHGLGVSALELSRFMHSLFGDRAAVRRSELTPPPRDASDRAIGVGTASARSRRRRGVRIAATAALTLGVAVATWRAGGGDGGEAASTPPSRTDVPAVMSVSPPEAPPASAPINLRTPTGSAARSGSPDLAITPGAPPEPPEARATVEDVTPAPPRVSDRPPARARTRATRGPARPARAVAPASAAPPPAVPPDLEKITPY